MARKKLIRTNQFPYHIWNRSRNKDWYQIPISTIWKYAQTIFKEIELKTTINLHAFVLMQNHYHMLITTPENNIDKIMYHFNKNLSLKIRSANNRQNQIFGGRYKWSIINNRKYLFHVFKYVLQNPINANIVNKCEDYKFSTWSYQYSQQNFSIPIHPISEELDKIITEDMLTWINRPYNQIQKISLSTGLKNGYFTPSNREQISLKFEDLFPPSFQQNRMKHTIETYN